VSDEVEAPEEAEDAAGQYEPCGHAWKVLGAQEMPPFPVFVGKPWPRTAVLLRCADCGDVADRVLTGHWSTTDFAALETERDETDT
jgi:hypothetical protein